MTDTNKAEVIEMKMGVVRIPDPQPSIDDFRSDYGTDTKVIKKSIFGQIDLQNYQTKEGNEVSDINLKFKEIPREVAIEILRKLKPYFKNPISPQLELFPINKEE